MDSAAAYADWANAKKHGKIVGSIIGVANLLGAGIEDDRSAQKWAKEQGLEIESPADFHARYIGLAMPGAAVSAARGRLPGTDREGSMAWLEFTSLVDMEHEYIAVVLPLARPGSLPERWVDNEDVGVQAFGEGLDPAALQEAAILNLGVSTSHDAICVYMRTEGTVAGARIEQFVGQAVGVGGEAGGCVAALKEGTLPAMGTPALATWQRPTLRLPGWLPRALLVGLASLIGLVLAFVVAANVWILAGASGQATDNVADVPHAQAAIVPGALVHEDGKMSAMLQARVDRAAELWEAGKVDRILVSGDHHTWAYDEPTTMRKELVAQGVPPRVIFQDHAGFDTHATVVRAQEIFGVESAVIVTQGFHMSRALFEADAAGLDATGLTADTQPWGAQGQKSSIREVFARVKAVAGAATGTSVMGGPEIPITGDGRASWGPMAPPGTPPAGSPGR